MKFVVIIFYTFFNCSISFGSYFENSYLDLEEPEVTKGSGQLVSKTKDALLSFDFIENRADYFVFKLKNLTFGDYSEDVLYIAPFFTGKLEVSMYDVHLYYNHFQNKTGLKYKIKF